MRPCWRSSRRRRTDGLDELLHGGDIPMEVCPPGDVHGLLDELLVGRTFTHRLDPAEVRHDVLLAVPDLVMLAELQHLRGLVVAEGLPRS